MTTSNGTDNVGRILSMNGEIEESAQLYIVQSEEDPNDKARKRMTHNSIEKKRKDKIRFWINKIGELLPPVENSSDKERIGRSTLEIVESAWEYITELKAQTQTNSDMTEDAQRLEIQRLKTELEKKKLENDRFVDIIRSAGLSTDSNPGLWAHKNTSPVLSTISINNQDIDTKQKTNKARKRNTISQQLENMKKQQEELSNPNVMQMNNQNLIMNQMQMLNNQMVMQNQAGFPQTFVQGQMTLPGQNLHNSNEKDPTGADLLQGAMQESGITPGSQPAPVEDVSQSSDQASALQTLASVASQNLISGSTTVVTSQSVTPSSVAQSSSVTTVTTQSINTNTPIMATGQMVQNNNGLMPSFVNGQQNFGGNMFPGQPGFNNPVIQPPQQQIVFLNDQGIPCIANVPLDPTAMMQNKLNNKEQQPLDQAFNQQQQMNMALQNQLASLASQNQVNMAGGLLQQQFPMNQQIIQSQLGTAINQQGLILPASQAGNLIPVNNMATNQNPLPQALILPNGQIVPVVTNPQMITGGQNQLIQTNQWRPPQPITSAPMQIIQPNQSQPAQDMQQSMGLLMTTNSVSSQSSPRPQISMATQSSSMSSTVSQSTLPNANKVIDSSNQDNTMNKVSSSADQMIQLPNNMLQQPHNSGLIPPTTGMMPATTGMMAPTAGMVPQTTSQIVTPSQLPKPANSTIVTSQPNAPQPISGNAPILINMVCNGQPTSILVDPTTMQVLGTVQTQQPPAPVTSTANTTGAPPQTTPPAGAKKVKKRAICPKPTVNGPNTEDATVEVPTADTKKSASSKSKPKTKKMEHTGSSTDILAEAAQSIFSSEISPGNFYNPANEDNPLQIDTSIAEPEDDLKKSPQKSAEGAKKSKESETEQDPVTKLIDQMKEVENPVKLNSDKPVDNLTNEGDIVASLLNQETTITSAVIESQQKQQEQANQNEPVSKKTRKAKKPELESSKEPEIGTSKYKSRKTSGSRKSKQDEADDSKDLPEEITFSENDLSSVLDQVEGFGSPTNKKTKSKKTRSDTGDVEPVSKKRKHTPTKSKVLNEMEKDTSAKQMTKSVYDFDEEMVEDFSQPLFGFNPLRGSSTSSFSHAKSTDSKKESKSSKKSSEKKKTKEVKMEDSLLSPGSDDLQINLDVEKSREEIIPFSTPPSETKKPDSINSTADKISQDSKLENNCSATFKTGKQTDFPNLEISNDITPSETLSDSQKCDSVFLSQSDIIPLDISTGNASNDSNDTMNTILGFANSLSPHIVSPKPRNQNQTSVAMTTNSLTSVSTSNVSVVTSSTSVMTSTPSSSQDLSIFMPESDKTSPPLSQSTSNMISKEKTDSLSLQAIKQNEKSSHHSATDKQSSSAQQPSVDISKKQNDSSKPKSIYSADNFVQSSRNDIISPSVSKYNDKPSSVQSKTSTSNLPVSYSTTNSRHNRSDFNDRPNTIKYTANQSTYRETSPDGFNFASIGLNLSTTAPSGSYIDNLNMSPILSTCSSSAVTTSTFTFTLSSVKTTLTSSHAPSTHGPSHPPQSTHSSSQSSTYPVYPQTGHHHSPGSSSSKPYHSMNVPNFEMDLTRNMNSQMNRNTVQPQQQQRSNHDRIPGMQNPNNVPFPYSDINRESCSMREQAREPPRERTPVFQNITATTPPIVNKSQSDQIRNTQKQIQDLNQNHSGPKQHADISRNMNTVERSAASLQPFFPPNPLNTPPLHHPPLSGMSDNTRQNMGARSSYEPSFPASQGYNSSSQGFRYDSNTMPYSSQNSSGTQPLSHTPPSSDGRKSANALVSNSKQSSNQSSRSMSGPSPGSGPTPPASNRHTPPQAVQPQSTMSKSQRPPTSSNSNSKKSKPSQKRSKQPSYEMEGMPYPYFDPNRVTPFLGFPPQALSPPQRNVQNDGHLFSGNFLGHSSRPLSNTASSMNKNPDLSGPFNSIFPPSRSQLNFQTGFGMNSMHPSMSNAPSLTPHSGGVTVTPHMSNFSFSNIFPDTSQSDSPINISPIKFHGNQIMDSNSLQHHQGSSLFHPHNRSHHPPLPNAMSINSILGHNHSFDTRQMPQSMNTSAPPFGSHGHPPTFGMPPF